LAATDTAGEQQGVKISASGYEIPMGQPRALGSYLDVEVKQNQVTVTGKVPKMQLQSLPVLTIQGSGDTKMQIIDAPAQDGRVVVKLPQPLPENSQMSVEVVASVSQQGVKAILAAQVSDPRFSAVDNDTAKKIQNAPRLNWR
jgi:hypothetical protein